MTKDVNPFGNLLSSELKKLMHSSDNHTSKVLDYTFDATPEDRKIADKLYNHAVDVDVWGPDIIQEFDRLLEYERANENRTLIQKIIHHFRRK